MELAAILGGQKSLTAQENFYAQTSWPFVGTDELQAIHKLFEDQNISTHPIIHELEDAYKKRIGRKYCVAHNNGTSALMASFWALGLQPGDQILVPTATFWASALPMMWHGLVPVFVESEGSELGMCLEDLKAKLSPKVKAIVLVALWGIPGNYGPVLEFAKENGLKVIEDASHAHGACFQGKPVGSFSDIAVFSLQGDKLAPAGEGGVFLTDSEEYYEQALLFGDITRIYQLENANRRFAATSFGIKTRIAPVSAAIGLEQLKKLDSQNQIRNTNMKRLSLALEKFGFKTFQDESHFERTYFEFVALAPEVKDATKELSKDLWVESFQAEGLDVSAPRYPLLHEQPFFTEGAFKRVLRIDDSLCPHYEAGGFNQTRHLNNSLIKFPCFTTKDTDLLELYIQAIEKVGAQQVEILRSRYQNDV